VLGYNESMSKRKKRKTTWGKYTKGAWSARGYAGWNDDGIDRFNQLCQMVKEDRESNATTEEHYKTHCLATLSTP